MTSPEFLDGGFNYRNIQHTETFWPPKVVWAREQGWLNVRDPWGTWHSIPAKEAPSGYVKLAMKAKGR